MPTYRNDDDKTYRVQDISNEVVNVIPGHTVETYDRNVPDDFTETLATPAKKVAISGENQWTDDVLVEGSVNVSISGEADWEATVTLQRRFDATEAHRDVRTFTADTEKAFTDDGVDPKVLYRIGVKEGEHTSKTIVVELNK